MALLLLWLGTGHAHADNAPLVAAAASLRHVWPHLMHAYPNPQKPLVTFGSSGNLARQIAQGAPFDLLLSADKTFPDWLVEKKATDQSPTIYAQGRLAWIAPSKSGLAMSIEQAKSTGIMSVNLSDSATKIAIANPAFAPYGRAAKNVLNQVEGADSLTLVIGENAAQALQFALSGATAGGIVPLALVSDSAREKLPDMVSIEIPENMHEPIIHAMVLIDKPSAPVQALFDFLVSDKAQAVFMMHGFLTAR